MAVIVRRRREIYTGIDVYESLSSGPEKERTWRERLRELALLTGEGGRNL